MNPIEELQNELDQLSRNRITADEKERSIKNEITKHIMQKYISGFMALQRNHGKIEQADFEHMMKGFAKEILELYRK